MRPSTHKVRRIDLLWRILLAIPFTYVRLHCHQWQLIAKMYYLEKRKFRSLAHS